MSEVQGNINHLQPSQPGTVAAIQPEIKQEVATAREQYITLKRDRRIEVAGRTRQEYIAAEANLRSLTIQQEIYQALLIQGTVLSPLHLGEEEEFIPPQAADQRAGALAKILQDKIIPAWRAQTGELRVGAGKTVVGRGTMRKGYDSYELVQAAVGLYHRLPTRCATSWLKSQALIRKRKPYRTGWGIRKIRPTQRDEAQKRQKRGSREDQPRKEGMRLHPEKSTCPRKGKAPAVKAVLGRRQPERGGKGGWDAEQPDRDWPSGEPASIASQPLLPAEAIARVVDATGSRRRWGAKRRPVATGSLRGAGVARAGCRHAGGLVGGSSARAAGPRPPGAGARAR